MASTQNGRHGASVQRLVVTDERDVNDTVPHLNLTLEAKHVLNKSLVIQLKPRAVILDHVLVRTLLQ